MQIVDFWDRQAMAIFKRQQTIRRLLVISMLSILCLTTSCAQRNPSVRLLDLPDRPTGSEIRKLSGDISEVAPPAVFLDLANLASNITPQVEITYPKSDQTLNKTEFAAKIKLRGLSIYKDKETQLGPHLKVILDNQPAQDIYDLNEPLEFSDLLPGSHSLRAFAVLPWGESFKNTDAYAQTTFHSLAKTAENTPSANQPVLTYNEPQGTFGAQPVLLDFHLNNAPLHLVAAENAEDNIHDWQIRCTVNGQTFLFDQWQPVYLKGLKPGQNWVQITLVDEQGDRIDGPFNSTVRLINYDPDKKDTLSKLVRGEIPIEQIGQIVIADYTPPLLEEITLEKPKEIEPETSIEDSLLEENAEPKVIEPEELIESEDIKPEVIEPEVIEPEVIEPEDVKSEKQEDSLDLREAENSPSTQNSVQATDENELDDQIESDSFDFELEESEEDRSVIPEDLNAPTGETEVEFFDEPADIPEQGTLQTPTLQAPLVPDFNKAEETPLEEEDNLTETAKTEKDSPTKPGLLEQLKTRWYSFQKAQTESQSDSLQPSTAPLEPVSPVETDPLEPLEPLEPIDETIEESFVEQIREAQKQQIEAEEDFSSSATVDTTDSPSGLAPNDSEREIEDPSDLGRSLPISP